MDGHTKQQTAEPAPDGPEDASRVGVLARGSPFPGRGEMAERCRAHDWASTPLGPVEGWSQSLRTAAAIVLTSRNPMFLWWGPELVQIYNDAYRPSFGASGRHPAALGMKGRECWTDIWDAIGPQIEGVMATGEAVWHENQLLPIERNGRLEDVWWTYSYSPVYDDDGSIAGTLVVCQETTHQVLARQERERLLAEAATAERSLRASEARYRSLFESLDEGFCVIEMLYDADGRPIDYRFLEANAAFVEQTGLEDALGKRMRELVPGHDDHWFEVYGRVASTGRGERFDAPATQMGRWYDVYAFRVDKPEDRRVAVLFKDVTAEKEDERERERLVLALRLERERLAEIFRQAPTFLAVLRGPDHVFELVNDAYLQVVGRRDIVGKTVLHALPEVAGQGFVEILDRVLTTGEPYVGREMPIRITRGPAGETEMRFIDFVYQPIRDTYGKITGIVAHGSDATEQVVARREVERLLAESDVARAEAEAANRSKSDFLAVMSHELRTPLNAIAGYADLMALGIRGPLTDEQRQDLTRVQISTRHLLALINDVLNYAKLEAGSVHYRLMDVEVGEAVHAAESLLRPQAQAKDIALVVDGCPRTVTARADPEKLQQILVNLLSNAVKFTGPAGRIDLECAETQGSVQITVRDTGVGIPERDFDGIFDPFVQVLVEPTTSREGTGLGLAISRDLARAMGGDVTVESRVGVGSTFRLVLPRGQVRRAAAG